MSTLPPDPLHVNHLGAGNDAFDCLEKTYPALMKAFYIAKEVKKSGQGAGKNLMEYILRNL